MLKIIKIELKRSFANNFFLMSILISSVLVIWYSLSILPFSVEHNNAFYTQEAPDNFLEVSFTNWIGSHNKVRQQNIFYLMLPILATLPFGGSLFSDIKEGYLVNILLRIKKQHYLLAKYIAVFVSGGSAVIIPMLFSFMISSAFLPTMQPQASYLYTNILALDKWSGIFFTNPFLYVGIYFFTVFVFSGAIACFALLISLVSYKSFLPLLFPFFVYVFTSQLFILIDQPGFSPMNIVTTTGEFPTTFSTLVMAFLFLVVSFFPYYTVSLRKEVIQFEK